MKNFYLYGIKLLAIVLAVNLSVISYAQDTPKSDTTSLFDLSLEELLNSDITTVSKKAEKQSDAPGIISVITKDDIARFGGTTLEEILNRVPGLISAGAAFGDPVVFVARGDRLRNNSGHILMLINGRPVREVFDGGVGSDLFRAFPINIIESIEVVKGPGSVLYGSDAFSAVINIITKKAEGFNVSASGIAGSGKGVNGDIAVKAGDFSVVAAGRYLKKNPVEVSHNITWTDSSGFQIIPIKEDIQDKETGGFVEMKYSGFKVMSSYNEWETSNNMPGLAGQLVDIKKWFNNVGYNLELSENWNMDFNITYTDAQLGGFIKRTSKNYSGEWTNFINIIPDKSKLIFGLVYNQNEGKEIGDFGMGPMELANGKIRNGALYSQLDYNLLNNLKLIAGFQAIKVDSIKLQVVPRFGAIYHPTEKFSIKALYSNAFRAPSGNETYSSLFGNSRLIPEMVSTIDLSFGYQGDSGQVAINFFQSKITDMIATFQSTIGSDLFARYKNLGSVTFRGVEFEGKYYANKSLYLSGSILYQTNEDDSSRVKAPVANFGAKGGISYVWDKGITAGLFNIYQGDYTDKLKDPFNDIKKQGAYNILNLHTNFNFNKLLNLSFKPEFNLFVDVNNILGQQHFGLDQIGLIAAPFINGRELYFGLNVKF